MDISKVTKKSLYYIFYSVLLFFCAVILIYTLYLLKPLNIKGGEYTFDIQKGESLYTVSERLASEGIITNPILMRRLLYYSKFNYVIYAGEYEVKSGMRTYDLIKKITLGSVKNHSLQIIEGSTLNDLLSKFKDSTTIKQTVDYNTGLASAETALLNQLRFLMKDSPDLMVNPAEISTLEGILFPDKYFYSKGETDISLIKRSFVKMNEILKQEWNNRKNKNDSIIKTPYAALILASILEKESSDKVDRKFVSGVVYNRLRNTMPLQVDPTVIYSLGAKYNGNLTKDDLKFQSRYNTYVNYGLPPGPIGFISLDAINAALNPEIHNLIYFVSMGNGKHFFSATLEEHNAAVQKYQKSSSSSTPANKALTSPEKSVMPADKSVTPAEKTVKPVEKTVKPTDKPEVPLEKSAMPVTKSVLQKTDSSSSLSKTITESDPKVSSDKNKQLPHNIKKLDKEVKTIDKNSKTLSFNTKTSERKTKVLIEHYTVQDASNEVHKSKAES